MLPDTRYDKRPIVLAWFNITHTCHYLEYDFYKQLFLAEFKWRNEHKGLYLPITYKDVHITAKVQ